MRDHGVMPDLIRDLRTLGYTDLSAGDIVRLRDHGVTGDFIRDVNRGGRRSAEELVRLRTGG